MSRVYRITDAVRVGAAARGLRSRKAERNALVAAYYRAGHSIEATAEAHGISPTVVRGVLLREGVTLRSCGARASFWTVPGRVETLVAEWGKISADDIAVKLGTTKAAVIGKVYRLDLPTGA